MLSGWHKLEQQLSALHGERHLYGLETVVPGRPYDDGMLRVLPSHGARILNVLLNDVNLSLQRAL